MCVCVCVRACVRVCVCVHKSARERMRDTKYWHVCILALADSTVWLGCRIDKCHGIAPQSVLTTHIH